MEKTYKTLEDRIHLTISEKKDAADLIADIYNAFADNVITGTQCDELLKQLEDAGYEI